MDVNNRGCANNVESVENRVQQTNQVGVNPSSGFRSEEVREEQEGSASRAQESLHHQVAPRTFAQVWSRDLPGVTPIREKARSRIVVVI